MAKKRKGGQQYNMPIPIDGDRRIVIQDVSTMVDQEKRITRMESLFFFILILLIVFVFFGDEIKAWLGSTTWWQTVVDNTPDWIKDNVPSPPTREKDPRTGRIPVVSAVLLGLAGLATTMILGYGAFVLFRRRRVKKIEEEKKWGDFFELAKKAKNDQNPAAIHVAEQGAFFSRLLSDEPEVVQVMLKNGKMGTQIKYNETKQSELWKRAAKEVTGEMLENLPFGQRPDSGQFLEEIEKRFKKLGGSLKRVKDYSERKKEMLGKIELSYLREKDATDDEIETLRKKLGLSKEFVEQEMNRMDLEDFVSTQTEELKKLFLLKSSELSEEEYEVLKNTSLKEFGKELRTQFGLKKSNIEQKIRALERSLPAQARPKKE